MLKTSQHLLQHLTVLDYYVDARQYGVNNHDDVGLELTTALFD